MLTLDNEIKGGGQPWLQSRVILLNLHRDVEDLDARIGASLLEPCQRADLQDPAMKDGARVGLEQHLNWASYLHLANVNLVDLGIGHNRREVRQVEDRLPLIRNHAKLYLLSGLFSAQSRINNEAILGGLKPGAAESRLGGFNRFLGLLHIGLFPLYGRLEGLEL